MSGKNCWDYGAFERSAASAAMAEKAPQAEMSYGAPFVELTIDLDGAAGSVAQHYQSGGWGIIYRTEGSAAGGRLDIDIGGGRIQSLAPGNMLRGRFRDFTAVRSSSSVQSGNAKLLIVKAPDAGFGESAPFAESAGGGATSEGIVSTSYTAALQTAAYAAKPTVATDGLSLEGVKAVRCTVAPESVMQISESGHARVWLYSSLTGKWAYSSVALPIHDAGAADTPCVLPEIPVSVPTGRMFLEIVMAAALGPSGYDSLTVTLEGVR